jgi:valyl-tRNA synthetase
MLDIGKECERLRKELGTIGEAAAKLEAKLSNESFVAKAPEAVVQRERDRLAELNTEAAKIQELLSSLC